MNIDEAIEILKNEHRDAYHLHYAQQKDAFQLGIEALTYIRECQINENCFNISLLPGQTED